MRQSFLAACVCVGVVGCSMPSGPPLSTLQQIQGEIIQFDADGYVIRDGYGKELRVHPTPTARVDGNLSPGDTVLVHVAAPYQPNARYAQAVYHFSDVATVYGELTEKNPSSIRVKDAAADGEVELSLDKYSVGYGRPQPGDRIFAKTYRAPYEGEVQEFGDGSYTIRDITGREVRYERGDNSESADPKRRRAVERPVLRHDRPYARTIYLFSDPLTVQGTLLRRDDGLYAVTGSEDLSLILGRATLRDTQEQPGEQVFVVLSPLPVIQVSSIEKL